MIGEAILAGADARLIALFESVDREFPCRVLESVRGYVQQVKNVAAGVSKTFDSKHLLVDKNGNKARDVAEAVDVAPFVLRWPKRPRPDATDYALREWSKDLALFYYFGGYVLARAKALELSIRWGGDWDNDRDIKEQNFDDLVHFELLG